MESDVEVSLILKADSPLICPRTKRRNSGRRRRGRRLLRGKGAGLALCRAASAETERIVGRMPYLNRLWPPGQRYEVTVRAACPETREVHWRGEARSAEWAIRSARAAWSRSFGAVPDDALISCDRASEPCQTCSGRGWVPTDRTEDSRAATGKPAQVRRKRPCPTCRGFHAEAIEWHPDGRRNVKRSSGTEILPGEEGYLPPPGPPGSWKAPAPHRGWRPRLRPRPERF
jgi:hypothetical protein